MDPTSKKFEEVVVVTVYLSSLWVRSQPSFFCIINYDLFLSFSYLIVLHAWALEWSGVYSLDTFGCFEEAGDLNYFLYREVWGLVYFLIEDHFQLFVLVDFLQKCSIILTLTFRNIHQALGNSIDAISSDSLHTRFINIGDMWILFENETVIITEIITFYFWNLAVVSELSKTLYPATVFNDYFPLGLWQLVKLTLSLRSENVFGKLLPQNVVHQVLVLSVCMVLDRQYYRVVVRVVLQKLVDSLNCVSKCYRSAESFSLNSMCNYWLVVSLVVDVQFHTFYAFVQILNVSGDFTVTCKLISCQIGVVWAETKVVNQR